MAISHTKKFGVYHWDTFDNETFLVGQSDSPKGADKIIDRKYKGRFSVHGADKVEVVDRNGKILRSKCVC